MMLAFEQWDANFSFETLKLLSSACLIGIKLQELGGILMFDFLMS